MRTKNFTIEEVIHSPIDRFPKDLLPIAYYVLGKMQTIRDYLATPIIITSGYRSAEHNEEIGGAKNSRHIWRFSETQQPIWAVDCHSPDMDTRELYRYIKEMISGEVYYHSIKEFVHLSDSSPIKEPWIL